MLQIANVDVEAEQSTLMADLSRPQQAQPGNSWSISLSAGKSSHTSPPVAVVGSSGYLRCCAVLE